jgi:ankyrin repeat protein
MVTTILAAVESIAPAGSSSLTHALLVRQKDKYGLTPLHVAAMEGCPQTAAVSTQL